MPTFEEPSPTQEQPQQSGSQGGAAQEFRPKRGKDHVKTPSVRIKPISVPTATWTPKDLGGKPDTGLFGLFNRKDGHKKKSLWRRMVIAIRKLLGLSPKKKKKRRGSRSRGRSNTPNNRNGNYRPRNRNPQQNNRQGPQKRGEGRSNNNRNRGGNKQNASQPQGNRQNNPERSKPARRPQPQGNRPNRPQGGKPRNRNNRPERKPE